jgi:hypothetical protein
VPDRQTLGVQAVNAARRNVARIGRSFDAALSTCSLIQLPRPYHRTWVRSRGDWQAIDAVLSAVYLASDAGVVREGGGGFIAVDVVGSDRAHELETMSAARGEQLQAFVEQRLDRDDWQLNPDPRQLVSALLTLVSSSSLTAPWLWDIGTHQRLVYGLCFSKT